MLQGGVGKGGVGGRCVRKEKTPFGFKRNRREERVRQGRVGRMRFWKFPDRKFKLLKSKLVLKRAG